MNPLHEVKDLGLELAHQIVGGKPAEHRPGSDICSTCQALQAVARLTHPLPRTVLTCLGDLLHPLGRELLQGQYRRR